MEPVSYTLDQSIEVSNEHDFRVLMASVLMAGDSVSHLTFGKGGFATVVPCAGFPEHIVFDLLEESAKQAIRTGCVVVDAMTPAVVHLLGWRGLLDEEFSFQLSYDGHIVSVKAEAIASALAAGDISTKVRFAVESQPEATLTYFRQGTEPRAFLVSDKVCSGFTYTQDRDLGLVRFATRDGVRGVVFNPARRDAELFLEQNGISPGNTRVVSEIEGWYSFNDAVSSINLTPRFVDHWWNYDAPRLSHWQPRTTDTLRRIRAHDMALYSYRTVVDSDMHRVFTMGQMTDDEIKKLLLAPGREGNIYADQARIELDKRQGNSDQEEVVSALVDDVMKAHSQLSNYLLAPERQQTITADIDDRSHAYANALDCGFVKILPPMAISSKIKQLYHMIGYEGVLKRELPLDYKGAFDLPREFYRTQSITAITQALRPHVEAMGTGWSLAATFD